MIEIAAYIEELELPPPVSRGPKAEALPPPTYKAVSQAVTVGSQMAEFSSNVPQAIRPAISNGLLLGQLAADKATANNPDPLAWFVAFNKVMKGIGWQSTLSELSEQTISDKNAALHKAIIPIVTAVFGPGVAASSIILAVLNGLEFNGSGRSLDHDF